MKNELKTNKMKKYTNKQKEEMYLDWYNNYLSTNLFSEHYELSNSETENIIEEGRRINHNN